jgi:hypothetical protein
MVNMRTIKKCPDRLPWTKLDFDMFDDDDEDNDEGVV